MSTNTGTDAHHKRRDSHLSSPHPERGAMTPAARTGRLTTPVLSRAPSPLDKSGDELPLGRARTMPVKSQAGLDPLPRNFAGLNLSKLRSESPHKLPRASTMPEQYTGFDKEDREQYGGQSTPPHFRNRGKDGDSSNQSARDSAKGAGVPDRFTADYLDNIHMRRKTDPLNRPQNRFQDSTDSDGSQSGTEMIKTDRKGLRGRRSSRA